MNILFLTSRFLYPPDRGDKVRPLNFARMLARHHAVFSLSIAEEDVDERRVDALRNIFEKVECVVLPPWRAKLQMAAYYPSLTPIKVGAVRSMKLQRRVNQRLKDWSIDLVYAFPYRMGCFVKKHKGLYKVLDFCDAESLIMHRWMRCQRLSFRPIIYWEWLKMRRYEARISAGFEECWVISADDLKALDESVRQRAHMIPNGVDTDYFRPTHNEVRDKNLLFVGYMGAESLDAIDYFYKHIFPTVRAREPEARFFVVGANPPARLSVLGEKDRNVIVTGFVEDLRYYYNRAAILVAPMRFVGGMQNKILQAMAMEVPVVASTYANEGINATPGYEILVADEPHDFAASVLDLLNTPEKCRTIGRRARIFVKSHFSWACVAERITRIAKNLNIS